MADDNAELLIGSRDSEFLLVRPTGRATPGTDDYWDGNWLDTDVEISVGAFRARYVVCLRVDELVRFRDQLVALYETIDGQAAFETMEDWLSVNVTGDGLGHYTVECQARDDPGMGNTLEFRLYFDQTQIPTVVAGLDRALVRFPLVGSRDA